MQENEQFEEDRQIFNEYDFPYLSYTVPQTASFDNLSEQEDQMIMRLGDKERKNYVFLDDFYGNKVKVRTHTPGSQMSSSQQIRLLFYQPCSEYCCFVFIVCNQIQKNKGKDQKKKEDTRNANEKFPTFSENKVTKKSYIFVRKEREEMETIFATSNDNSGDKDVLKA